jgi:hypothetical protein
VPQLVGFYLTDEFPLIVSARLFSPGAIGILAMTTALAACGGGGSAKPPPPVAPVFTTPTAVRVSRATPFSASCLPSPGGTTIYGNAEVEPQLAIDPSDPNHLLAAWQQDRLSTGGALGLVNAVSVDGGVTWSAPRSMPFSQCASGSYARASDPWVSVNGVVAFHVGIAFSGAILTAGARSAVVVSRSGDGGFSWAAPVELENDDGSLFFNDKESVTIDPTDTRYVYAVWDRLDSSNRGPTRFARSQDGGLSWEPAVTIYDPGAGAQTIGNIVVVAPSGIVHNFFTELVAVPGNPNLVTGRVAVISSGDKGQSWSAPVYIADLRSVSTQDPSRPAVNVRAGEILGSFAADPLRGTLYASWQDSRFSSGARNAIAISGSIDGGATWTAPVRVNADPTVPAFTPTLTVQDDGTIGVLYYDFRAASTSSTRPTDLWLAVSQAGGAWREARLAGNFDMLNAPNAEGLFVGDYQGLVSAGRSIVSLYARVNNGDTANRTDIFADRTDSSAIMSAAETRSVESVQMTASWIWDEAAQERVERHLAELRDQRRRQWREWLGSHGDSPIE